MICGRLRGAGIAPSSLPLIRKGAAYAADERNDPAGGKVYIIQSIDRKMDLEDIAAARNLDIRDLLTEIEAIVSTGTRVNINYYIEEELDPDVVEEIFTWFKEEATSDSLSEALAALEDEYEELEIRLVRIKFLCEIAN